MGEITLNYDPWYKITKNQWAKRPGRYNIQYERLMGDELWEIYQFVDSNSEYGKSGKPHGQ
jgi:hypothetical protein